MKAKILVNGRGGCGKSTLTSILSKKLSQNNKVLVIDIDEGKMDDDINIVGKIDYNPVISQSNIMGVELDVDSIKGIDEIIAKL